MCMEKKCIMWCLLCMDCLVRPLVLCPGVERKFQPQRYLELNMMFIRLTGGKNEKNNHRGDGMLTYVSHVNQQVWTTRN